MFKKITFAAALAAVIGCSSAFAAFAETAEGTYDTYEPTYEPTEEPTDEPTYEPTYEPTEEPTGEPADEPSTEETDEPSPAIWFDFYTTELKVGESVSLGARVVYGEWEDPVIEFESSDESIATVDQNGYVTAVGEGTAYVTSTFEDLYTYATIIVTQPEIPEHIEFEHGSFDLKIGETAQIAARVLPDSGDEYTFTYASSDPEVAMVNERGFVTALKAGSVTVTVSGAGLTGSVTVNVTSGIAPDTVKLDGYLYSGGSPAQGVRLVVGGLVSETAADGSFSFGQVSRGEITLSLADDSNAFCKVTPQGDTTLYLQYENGVFTSRSSLEELSNSAPTASVSFTTGAEVRLKAGETFETAYRCEPQGLVITGISYLSSNPTVAAVGQMDGVITAKAEGEAVITLTINGGQARTTCRVVVEPKAGSKYVTVIIAAAVALAAALAIVILMLAGKNKKRAPDAAEYADNNEDDNEDEDETDEDEDDE